MEGLQRDYLELEGSVGELVLPGDSFKFPSLPPNQKMVIGPGLKLLPSTATDDERTQRIVACKSGILRNVKGNTFFVEFKTKNYDNFKKDDVVGIIKQKGKGEQYAVDVGMRERAQLSKFAFEGATKRFRPDLQVGDVVYGKVVDLPPDFPMEITCVHSSGKALGLGALEGGHVFQVPVHFTRLLRTAVERDNLLKVVGRMVPCETAVGVNGLVWVKAKNAVLTVLVAQLIIKLSTASPSDYDTIFRAFRKGITSLAQ